MQKGSLLLSAFLAFGCHAQEFTISNGASGSTNFKQTEITPDGTKLFAGISTFKSMSGTSKDIYTVKCSSNFVAVRWGETSGGVTGIRLPVGGSSVITNHEDKAKIISHACGKSIQ